MGHGRVSGDGSGVGSVPELLLSGLLRLFATSFFLRTCIFWILIGGSLVAMLNSYLLRKIFKKYFELD